MCGIAGVLRYDDGASPQREALERMVRMLHHRGPDGSGFYIDSNIGLGHARLSIIDPAGGQQPIHNEDKSVWVAFNGEIFNYLELRGDLEKQGHRFYTHSDTEVIVHLYEQHGDEFVQHLNGQFAIALWDSARRRLVLVRDRIGILPLFYTENDRALFFASEVKSLLAGIGRAPALNPRGLDQLMTFWSPVSPETVFKDVFEVSPGEMVVVHSGKLIKRRYWDWNFPQDGNYRRESEDDLARELHDLLVDATRLRLRADVPVGAYLSGGLDSSVLVSLIHRYGGVKLRTFSIGFEDSALDESSYQRQMIEHLGAEHSNVFCRTAEIGHRFIDTIWHTESPVLRTAPVPMGILSGLVREQGYKVVLTGEGSDEVLGGYDIFKEAKVRQFWARNPQSRWRPLLLKKLYPYLDLSKTQGLAYLQNFFGTGLPAPDQPCFSHLPRWETTAKCKEFFSKDLKSQLNENAMEMMTSSLPPAMSTFAPFNKAQYIEAKSLMAGYLLCSQGDRMLMKNSVEGRFPFLDHRVIEFANRLKPSLKMKVLKEKYLLKRAMDKYLPKSIVGRYKQPYRAPDIPAFFGKNSKLEYVGQLMALGKIRDYGYFDPDKVEKLVRKIEAGRAASAKDNMALVGILSTQVWHHLFIDDFSRNIASK